MTPEAPNLASDNVNMHFVLSCGFSPEFKVLHPNQFIHIYCSFELKDQHRDPTEGKPYTIKVELTLINPFFKTSTSFKVSDMSW